MSDKKSKKNIVSAERYPGSKDKTNNIGEYMEFYEKTEYGWERTSRQQKELL